ncbi:MAG: CheR family methyltransferase [Phycisphaerae bacterium]
MAKQPQRKQSKPDPVAPGAEMQRIFTLLRNASGVDFTHYKQPTIRRRLQRRMVLRKAQSLRQYLEYLQANPAEVNALYQDILIHVTRFFREPESFEVLQNKILPKLTEKRLNESPIRVWVPGCSTGEEPYSIAIAIIEHLGEQANACPVQVFATDVSDAAIERARAGTYPESISEDVSPERLRRFFTKTDGHYRIAKNVRDCCIFARQDLTRDPPFSKLDLILCRNVLIYLGPPLQKRLMNIFHYALKPTGFLMLGSAETVGPNIDLFTIIDKRHKLYAKKMTAVRTEVDFPPVETIAARIDASRRIPTEPRPANTIQNEATRIILAKFSPPGVIVDTDLKIVQFRGQTGDYLEPAPGEASLNLLKMAREGLLYGLRSAIHEARKTESEVRKDGLRIKAPTGSVDLTLTVCPLGANSPEGRHFLILFERPSSAPAAAAPTDGAELAVRPAKRAKPEREDKRIARLQQELAASREYLQSIIQDLEAANEELQSANEEVLSSNEELQSTNEELDTAKEELQSTNEELNTLNEELHGRNEELMHANSDLVNLLASVQIAIVMVAADLRIRRFTPMAEKILNLIPTDIGRPISDIKPNIECPDLEKLIIEAIDAVTIKQLNVRDKAGNTYSLRIRPYKNIENRIDGAVLALFEESVSRANPSS